MAVDEDAWAVDVDKGAMQSTSASRWRELRMVTNEGWRTLIVLRSRLEMIGRWTTHALH